MGRTINRDRGVLDDFDYAILDVLKRDNRTPQRTIAEQVNLSPAAVQRRIAAMEANGTIIANVAVVSPDVDGRKVAIVVEVHLLNDRSELVEAAKALFRRQNEIRQCYYVAGNGGFIMIVEVPDMRRYEALARDLFADNDSVSTYRTLVVLDQVKVPYVPMNGESA